MPSFRAEECYSDQDCARSAVCSAGACVPRADTDASTRDAAATRDGEPADARARDAERTDAMAADGEPTDAPEPADAPERDAEPTDAAGGDGEPNNGRTDGAVTDAALTDAARTDASAADARTDAAATDAATTDAVATDAAATDAAATDAAADAAATDAAAADARTDAAATDAARADAASLDAGGADGGVECVVPGDCTRGLSCQRASCRGGRCAYDSTCGQCQRCSTLNGGTCLNDTGPTCGVLYDCSDYLYGFVETATEKRCHALAPRAVEGMCLNGACTPPAVSVACTRLGPGRDLARCDLDCALAPAGGCMPFEAVSTHDRSAYCMLSGDTATCSGQRCDNTMSASVAYRELRTCTDGACYWRIIEDCGNHVCVVGFGGSSCSTDCRINPCVALAMCQPNGQCCEPNPPGPADCD